VSSGDVLRNSRFKVEFAAIGSPREADRGYAAHDIGVRISLAERHPAILVAECGTLAGQRGANQ
jgi:hypothetical protein